MNAPLALQGAELLAYLQPHVRDSLRKGEPLALLRMSLIGARAVAIQHGAVIAESLARKMQVQAQAALRPGDEVIALGAHEFAVLLPRVNDGNHALLAATRLLRQFEQAMDVDGRMLLTTVAVGVAVTPEHGDDADSLCRSAEAALLLAESSADRMSLAPPREATPLITPADLREAIQAGQLEVHFQPIWDLRAARITGAESLARWTHPRLGPISPAQFVALAESSGLIAEFTRWSVNASLQHCVDARKAGLRLPVSVNLSAVAFAERGLVEHLLDALKLWGVPPRDLVIEVTETAIIADLDKGAHILNRLSDAGVRVSIDDFGVGNSSFAYLREFPATELKIDRSFITGMIQKPRSMQLAKAMIDFAHHLGMQVVAEGVEDKETLGTLAELDCDYAQGYVLGHAKPAAQFVAAMLAAR
ncbi:putative bifunctional diguanylate cyclase/phosphodiesterase [Arenimonas alkanexedens]